MNEMRKLMEVVEQIEDQKTVENILSYFSGHAGKIKDGYIAKFAADHDDEFVTQIHVLAGGGGISNRQPDEENYRKYGINRWEVGDSELLSVRIYRLQKVL